MLFLAIYGWCIFVMFFILLAIMLNGVDKVREYDIFVLCLGSLLWPYACFILWKTLSDKE